MPAFKLGILPLAFRPTAAEEIITRSPTRRVITIAVPAPSSVLSTSSSLHADELHLVLLVWVVIEARHAEGTNKCFHSDCSNSIKEIVHHSSRTIARV